VTDDEVKAAVAQLKERDRAAGLSDTLEKPEVLAELGRIVADAERGSVPPARSSTRSTRSP
jgi:hypothetical protein